MADAHGKHIILEQYSVQQQSHQNADQITKLTYLYRSEDVTVALFTRACISLPKMLVGTMLDIQLISDLFVQEGNKPFRSSNNKKCIQQADVQHTYSLQTASSFCKLDLLWRPKAENSQKERGAGGGKDMQVSICSSDDGGDRHSCPSKAVGGTFCHEHGGQEQDPISKTCSVEGCDKLIFARGKCCVHDGQICSVQACNKLLFARGKCQTHDGQICSVEGYGKLVRAHGKCLVHDGQICSVKGCDKVVRPHGKCWKHKKKNIRSSSDP
eukprot:scaffold41064_cov67-Cyclotella_meneghiniana.AAC.1